ncbi:MAG: ABC transporter permease [Candidatus Hydrogenedentes bacterium]|nr:ABC transporter permease [Candidatus Hydrogenedentota bacterium]
MDSRLAGRYSTSPLAPARLKRTIILGFKSLWLHRLRSLLTVLGIVFGVCSVIAMLAVGEGASFEAQEQIRRLGSNNIILKSVKPPDTGSTSSEQSYVIEYGLTYNDLERIRGTIPGVSVIVPNRVIRKRVWNATNRADAEVVGTVPWFPEMRRLNILEGRFFSDLEMETKKNVCVLSASVAPALFPFENPIGGRVRIDSDYYQVIGVTDVESTRPGLAKNEGSRAADSSSTDRIYIPLKTARARFGEVLRTRSSGSFNNEKVELHEATIQVHDQNDVEETALIIGDILGRYHKKKDFEIEVPLELLRSAEETARTFNILLGSIAAISLLVGGIGIMNIMLASVTERTREIGIRRALGAKHRDIITQFLIETVLLSATGGALGVLFGVTLPIAIGFFTDMRTIVTPDGPILAFSISAIVGIIFGIYPAVRAATMDPVEALRHE